ISSSMRGAKIEDAKTALQAFLAQIEGDLEQVGLITFASEVEERVPLTPLGEGRARLTQAIDALSVSGNTALVDGVAIAYGRLRNRAEPERINAIVVMTDGIENRSRTRLSALTEQLREAARSDLPVLVFCIAYGRDADYETLRTISDAAGGFTERGDLETIQRLYEALSTYF
ncbi:MAG: VWA domain-containing protein, partial [Anaerolineae bacterium]|nr:VWA domain-containing protein [Anaerolineae bacterium]